MRLHVWHLTTNLTLGFLPNKSGSNDTADKLLSISIIHTHMIFFNFILGSQLYTEQRW
jgi:hypothetical protein